MNTAYRVSSTLDATARPPSWGLPRWPTTAVSARTYSGSAMRAPSAGTARAAISRSCGLRSRRRASVVGSVMSRSAPTDGAFYHLAGVPVMNFLTAPFYLFDEMDTLDKVDRDNLESLTRATFRIVDSTAGVSAAELRAGVGTATDSD